MSLEVRFYLIAMVVAGLLACIPPGSLVLVAASGFFALLALGQNFDDRGGFA